MFKRLIYLICFVLALSLVGDVQAADVAWTDTAGNHLWSTPANWDTGAPPTSADTVKIRISPGPTVTNQDAVANVVQPAAGSNNTGDLTVDGGTLTVANWFTLAQGVDSNAILNMNSGTITVDTGFNVAYQGSGTLNMTGGTITVAGPFYIAQKSVATGHANLDGGTITTNSFSMRGEAGSVGTMDIRAGTLIINGDAVSSVQGYIDNGWITSYDGYGTLQLDYDVTNEGRTTLKAVHILNPNPTDGSSVSASVNQLQWTLPEPNIPGGVVTCDVFFGTNPDVEANPKVVIGQTVESVSVMLASLTTYYWTFDLYDSSISTTEPIHLSPIFTFNTSNKPPDVNAGDDVATWLDNGLKVVQLDGVVSDEDGGPGPATLVWTVIAEPNELNPSQISDPLAANPTVTLIEPGSYTLQLEAGDGEFTTTDTMQIVLYADSCEHAKNQEGFELIPGDINEDCMVNELDIVILIEHWLEENYSTE